MKIRTHVKRIPMCLAVAFLIVHIAGATVFGDTAGTGYTTESFNVDVVVTEDHICHVTETVDVDFLSPRHGIFRYIPYEPGKYDIRKIDVDGDRFDVETQSDNGVNRKIIRIGDEDKTLTGRHTYRISYDVTAYEDRITTADYFSLDVLPTGWDTAIGETNIRVKFPKAIDPDILQIYSGRYGLSGNDCEIKAKYNGDENTVTIKAKDLYQGMGITLYSELPQGYWVGALNREWMLKPLVAILIALPLFMFALWILFGRDPKVIKTVEFYPPEGMTPAEIGYIIDGTVDTKDITSLIIYYASKGWLSINEYKKDKFKLKKLTPIDPAEKSFSKTVFNALFQDDDEVELSELPDTFGEMFMVSKSQLKGYYREENSLFTASSRVCRGIGMALMFLPAIASILAGALISFNYMYTVALIPSLIFLIIGLFMVIVTFDRIETYKKSKTMLMMAIAVLLILIGTGFSATVPALATDIYLMIPLVFASMLITFVFVLLMHKRTEKSARWQGKILGFRDFIKTAELKKLNMLIEENPEYFYNIMPYAYVMGLSDKWAKNFEYIPMKTPDWYYGAGQTHSFNTLWYMHMFNSCTKTFATSAISSVAGSSADTGSGGSSGFGGGFSGGGFGGGGGGSW